ncbi:hypothetical protein [Pendulispora albinea]|uniref:Uncharacterized protein n=1 Tax=Pendulispora albinea TaxID=2741071 RepID=A0ABZ2LX44_9BACT
MKRSSAMTIAVLCASSAGVMLAAACVGDEPGALPGIPDGGQGGDQDAYRPPPGDGGTPVDTPKSVAGLVFWLDGADSNAVQRVKPGTDETVTKWADKSPNARDFAPVPAEGCAAPTFDLAALNQRTKSALHFNRVDKQCLKGKTLQGLSAAEAFIVYQTVQIANTDDAGVISYGLWQFGSYNPQHPSWYRDNDYAEWWDTFGNTGTPYNESKVVERGHYWEPRIFGVVSAPNKWFAYFNGVERPATAANETQKYGFGAASFLGISIYPNIGGNYFNGYIGEVIAFDRQLPEADHLKIQSYLSAKWGIPLAKPDGGT